jgi:tetratricopeptide (TPR) repeat protein
VREKDFSIYNKKHKVRIKGGHLWKASSHKENGGGMHLDEKIKSLSIFLHPSDTFIEVQNGLYDLIKKKNPIYYFLLSFIKRVPSLLLLLPITMMVIFLAVITVWGDFVINWVFMKDNTPTIFGMYINEAAVYTTLFCILIIYFFPVLLTGEQDGFIDALNERFANREKLRKRLAFLVKFLKSKGYINSVEIWNPNLANEQHDWVGKSLIPALFDANLELVLHIRVDERRLVENHIQKKSKEDLIWEEEEVEQDGDYWGSTAQCIPYEYLEPWEKNLIAVYTFASTASLSKDWKNLKGTENDGVLNNTVSLRLVKVLVDKFKERLFSEKDLDKLISLDLFASRCLNDYGILFPALRYTNDVWAIEEEIVQLQMGEVADEMKFMTSFLQTEISELIIVLSDPVAAVKLNNAQEYESIYNENRLTAIRFFVQVIYQTEQYKILKQYWSFIIKNPYDDKNMNEDVYRILGVDLLLNLATIFERAAMYSHAKEALDYIERIFPFKGKVGKARIKERQGGFEESVISMLQIRNDSTAGNIKLHEEFLIELSLDISWAIVSGRLEEYRVVGRETIAEAKMLLYSTFDVVRNSEQLIRLYNILANYEEWEGKPQGAIDNYDKALRIPGVQQAGLSNLLVNKGIALRQMKLLQEGAVYGEQGVEIKTAIGDADQLPIALHNLAQTYIELAFSIQEEERRMPYFTKAVEHAQTGLDIQSSTGSVKKRGQLLAEKFVGQYELIRINSGPRNDLLTSLEAVQDWLKLERAAGRGNAYDCRVVVGELLGSLAVFEGQTLEDAIAWEI